MDNFIYNGFFGYPSQEGMEPKKETSFQLVIDRNEGSFNGWATDSETKELFPDGQISIKGFFEEDMVSFLKTYPFAYFINEQNETEVDYSRPAYTVEYLGYWNPEESKFTGNYTIVMESWMHDRYKGLFMENYYEGPWEMQPE